MLIKNNDPAAPCPSEITGKDLYQGRRRFLRQAGALGGALWLGQAEASPAPAQLPPFKPGQPLPDEPLTSLDTLTSYGNFYEFGPNKDSPGRNAHTLKTRPWSVEVDGEVLKPRRFDLDELLRLPPLEERIYRLRCVEGWSAVVPWIGFPLAELIRRVQPTGNARYLEFLSLADPVQMPFVQYPTLDWPYREALRLDEAMHPLAILAVGLYGQVLPKPNGAPVRLVVPWKYGFKSGKSIVRIRFLEQQPRTSWMKVAPDEYGFYANVNPAVSHPRWSQAKERRLGEFFRRPTLPFNGYAAQVASLYAGMDLHRNY